MSALTIGIAAAALLAVVIARGGRANARLYPYYMTALWKTVGTLTLAAQRLRLVSRPNYDASPAALRRQTLAGFRRVAAAFDAIDGLPTIAAGIRALGVANALDAQLPFRRRSSRYSHARQRPFFYLPGVPAQPFYEARALPWAAHLEAAYPAIRRELDGLLTSRGRGFKQYQTEGRRLIPGWNTFNLFILGEPVHENCARCPATMAALESLPRCERQQVMFSALNPHTHIPAHHGPMNGVLRAHLPLIVPRDKCGIRVGGEPRTWEEGRVLVFDDAFDHEVWNDSDETRIVLFLNVWHPCFASEEIPALERFRDTVYAETTVAQEWGKVQRAPRPDGLVLALPAVGVGGGRA